MHQAGEAGSQEAEGVVIMNLTEMRTIVRRDLKDEDAANYWWTNDELDRHIAHAVKDFSEYLPYEQRSTKATTSGSRELDISTITDRLHSEMTRCR